jgi:hypothetical protein
MYTYTTTCSCYLEIHHSLRGQERAKGYKRGEERARGGKRGQEGARDTKGQEGGRGAILDEANEAERQQTQRAGSRVLFGAHLLQHPSQDPGLCSKNSKYVTSSLPML